MAKEKEDLGQRLIAINRVTEEIHGWSVFNYTIDEDDSEYSVDTFKTRKDARAYSKILKGFGNKTALFKSTRMTTGAGNIITVYQKVR